jgi:hypothetical protein
MAKCIPFPGVILPASSRSEDAIAGLLTDTAELIDEIELPKEFPPKESLDQLR